MDANSGEPWSEMDIADLTHSLDYGDTFAQTASFLCRDEDEVPEGAAAWASRASGQATRRPLDQSPVRDHQRDEDHDGEGDGAPLFKPRHGTSSSFAHAFQASQLF